jgi:VWFA-related protein
MNRLAALILAPAMAFAQNTPPPAGQIPNTAIRIDVNLVQVDAVVTDSRNRRVPDLQAPDFELLQDGKPQAITNFSYVSTKPAAGTAASLRAVAPKPVKGDVPPPPPVLQPTEVHRTLGFIVDDLGLAGENIPNVRNAIRKFLDDGMRPDDLVAIVRTGAGMGSLQQFTTDKRLLYEALDRVKYGESRVGMSSFAPLGSTPTGGRGGRGARGGESMDHFREDALAVGTLGAIRFVVNSMAGFPGRKSVVLFTENIRLIFRGATDQMVAQAVQQLSDAASRASVVIHAIDPRGLPNVNLTAEDNASRVSSRRVSRVPAQREQEVEHTEEGMFALSEATGGLFLHAVNDLEGALRKAADDSDGYYLLGYHPDSSTFESGGGQPRFHRLEVKVKKSGLHVRSREGFFGEPGSGNQSSEHTREGQLNRALQSPYAGSMHPRLTAVFSNLRQGGSSITAWIHFDAKELKWSSEPDGSHKAEVDVAAATFDENGSALAPVDTTFPLLFNAQQYDDALKKGVIYALRVPIGKPGPYLVRAALRDPATEGAGSAEQFVEVPDVESGHLAVSGIVVQEAAVRTGAEFPQTPAPRADITGGAAERAFRHGEPIAYYYEILNAASGADQHPELEVQTRIFHDGAQVLTDKAALQSSGALEDPQHLRASGHLAVGRDLPPGEYTLQVIVTDKLVKSKFNVATQSVDFEIEE